MSETADIPKKGLFIVIEGIDGSGGETQTKRLIEYLESKDREVITLSYPNPESPIGKVLYDFLEKRIDLKPEIQAALYITDFAMDKAKIADAIQKGKVVISNRYFYSTLAYQCGANGVPMDKAMKLAETMELHVPDLAIHLDISTETSMARKKKEKGELDRFEEDKELLDKVRKTYKQLAAEKTFAKEWFEIDGERKIDEVAEEIQRLIEERL